MCVHCVRVLCVFVCSLRVCVCVCVCVCSLRACVVCVDCVCVCVCVGVFTACVCYNSVLFFLISCTQELNLVSGAWLKSFREENTD